MQISDLHNATFGVGNKSLVSKIQDLQPDIIVITGDVTQIDLPSDKTSGLKDAIRVLEGVKDIAICPLTSADVVRHALVQEIINAYEKAEELKVKQNAKN